MQRRPTDETFPRTLAGLGSIVERLTPWLLDLGGWIFGALLAFDLLILGSLLTVGPADRAVIVSATAFALALPVEVAGFVLIRIAADMKDVSLEDVATEAFVEAGFSVEEQAAAPAPEVAERRRAGVVLRYSYGLLAVGTLLSLGGIAAALAHLAWWMGLAFVLATLASLFVVLRAIASTGSGDKVWRAPSGVVEPRKARTRRQKVS